MTSPMLLPDYYAQFGNERPTKPFCQVVEADDRTITTKTWAQVLQDAAFAAHKFRELGLPARQPGDPVLRVAAIMRGSYDGFVNLLAIWMNRWAPVLISPRLSAEVVTHLVEISESRALFADAVNDTVAAVQANIPSLKVVPIQRYCADGLAAYDCKSYRPWTAEETKRELENPVYYMHTSGSTGPPKLVPLSHSAWFGRLYRFMSYSGRSFFSPFPICHLAGIIGVTNWNFTYDLVPVFTESSEPLNGERFCNISTFLPDALCFVPPSFLEEIEAGPPELKKILAKAHRAIFAGAPLRQEVGDRLVDAGIKLLNVYGMTETGALAVLDVASENPYDWPYFRMVDPSQMQMSEVPQSDGLFRPVVRPGHMAAHALINSKDPVGFDTGDLLKEHPTIKGLWRYMGRSGSITILSNGEKTDNTQVETLVTSHPLIQYAVVFGEGRLQNGVILLPAATTWDSKELLQEIWPTIEHANTILPQHSRLVKPLVLLADPKKRFSLTDKATVRRQETLKWYAAEIDAAYKRIEEGTLAAELPKEGDLEGVRAYIRATIHELIKKDIPDDADFFASGMDSLMAMTCRSNLIPLCAVTHQNPHLPRNLVYHCPTINALFDYMTKGSESSLGNNSSKLQQGLDTVLQQTSFTKSVLTNGKKRTNGNVLSKQDRLAVILTGSTGTFGSQLLIVLLESPEIRTVYCLNRINKDVPALERQKKYLSDPSILDRHASKVKFFDMELAKENLGLAPDALAEVQHEVDLIVHCAWEVNFNHTLSHFIATQVTGLKNFVHLALSSTHVPPPTIMFLSSISAVMNYNGPEPSVPEVIFDDPSVALEQGYGQGKYFAEKFLQKAHEETGVPVTIVRVGQLSGTTYSGAWNPTEYIPILLRSCRALGQVPDPMPDVMWTPTDVAADVLLDIISHDAKAQAEHPSVLVRHLDTPHRLSGRTLTQWIVKASGGTLKPVSVDTWLQSVKESSSDKVPAKRLQQFYDTWLKSTDDRSLALTKTSQVSKIASCAPISADLVKKYFDAARA